jgi:hypothetical protein
VSGFGFALISVPFLIPFAGASAAVAAPPMLSFLTMGSSLHQRACPVAHGSVVSATPIVGMPFGVAGAATARCLMAVAGDGVHGNRDGDRRTHREFRDRSVAVAGLLSGGLLTSIGPGGPPLVA